LHLQEPQERSRTLYQMGLAQLDKGVKFFLRAGENNLRK